MIALFHIHSNSLFFLSVNVVLSELLSILLKKAINIKMDVFWIAVTCDLIEVCFRGTYCLHDQRLDDGGSKHL
jgi:hypothetical protein